MTPAERARLIDEQERRAESAAILQRALSRAQDKLAQDRARVDAWLGRPVPEPSKFIPKGRPANTVEAFGVKMTLAQWSNMSEHDAKTLRRRVRAGWPLEIAILAPRNTRLDIALTEYAGKRPAFLTGKPQ